MKKNQNFALPTFTQNTYAGEFAGQYIAAALLSAKTLDNKYVEIHPNVKFKEVIQKLDVSGIVQDASCDFVTSGSVSLSERILEPKELQVNLELCKQEFVDSWMAMQLGFSAFDTIPATFNDYLISYVGGKVAEVTEQNIWAGTNVNGQFAGFQTLLSASVAAGGAGAVLPAKSGSVIISGSITSANVISIFNSVVDTIPDTVYGKEDLLLYVGTGVAKAYQTALGGGAVGANGYNNQLTVGEKPYNFNGIDIVMCPGMSANKIVAAQKSNLFFGTGLLSDYNEVKVLDMSNIDGSQNYRIVMRFTSGVQFGIGQDIVYYGAY
uniref:Uncharacterized protein n=1 Tax=uncultured Caudovirales phage TaxID=2100421 RepID=A0A6J7X4W7_9CAUD|nr:hypothetical protein UFOVP385_29 [uncultured Caudovirales phage]